MINDEDRRVCYGIIDKIHHGKPFTLLKEVEYSDDSDHFRFVLDPAMVEIGLYFSSKYGNEKWMEYNKIFAAELFARHNEIVSSMNP